MEFRICSVCGDNKPLDIKEYCWIKPRNRFMYYCRKCHNKKLKVYKKNSKKFKERKRSYQQTNQYKEIAKKCRQRDHAKKSHRERERAARKRIKQNVISHYSNKTMLCGKCGFSDVRALTIDHVNGGGRKHRKELNLKAGHQFYTWLVNQNYPEGFQVLCMNCQFIKRVECKEHTQIID